MESRFLQVPKPLILLKSTHISKWYGFSLLYSIPNLAFSPNGGFFTPAWRIIPGLVSG